jgi:hypothetical protein
MGPFASILPSPRHVRLYNNLGYGAAVSESDAEETESTPLRMMPPSGPGLMGDLAEAADSSTEPGRGSRLFHPRTIRKTKPARVLKSLKRGRPLRASEEGIIVPA